jgi:lactoylglutathione lyase
MRAYRFDHVHLRCHDCEAMARFFETMFGADVKRDVYPDGTLYPGQPRVRMAVGGQTILTAPKHPNDAMTPAPPFPYYGLEHMGFTVDDVDAACAELKAAELKAKGAEIAVGPLTRSPGLRLAFVRGPEGIMVELVQGG